ncbi:MAG: polyprenyl synthetase family protein [Gammaproteobacteria bacterium]|nr:polyprenyl synthetase family protein [Gammaproteobacteria bacterium]MCY4277939.1 polyprenyl synthetase family protein [Gammaproteobacteria bacterium]
MTSATLEAWRAQVHTTLASHIDELPAGRLRDAMAYAVLGGGKRLRPLLCLAACVDAGGEHEKALIPACAVELIHCYSLAHDDLPCMDDDDERRGQPSLHKAFDEATALLAGDALQSLAFELLANSTKLAPSQRVRMLGELGEAGGVAGMAGGQMLDLRSHAAEDANLDYLTRTHAMKTGALFRASLRFGLLSSGGEMTLLDAFCTSFALAFQAADDLRDCLGSRAHLGKPTGSDARSGTLTWPRLLGIDAGKAACIEHREACFEQLRQLEFEATHLAEITHLALDIEDLR